MCVNSQGSLNVSGLQLAHPFGSIGLFKIFSVAHLGSAVIFHVIGWKTYTEKNNFSERGRYSYFFFAAFWEKKNGAGYGGIQNPVRAVSLV